MPYLIWMLLFFLVDSGAYAQSSVPLNYSFAPPATDLSLIYLSNMFGVVDGVLGGTGSQIFGRMMGVLNLIAIALGSMVILYTMIVGTLNTAHEGQFLGQKWSKIWIPIRCSMGLAMLIPKASGYSLIQILVMWIVVQGVGAADKVWNAALSYLNQGGKIVQAQASSSTVYSSTSTQTNPVYQAAATILTGQVCMYGLQKKIENLRNQYLSRAEDDANSPCSPQNPAYDDWQKFCNDPVPDFISSVNFMDYQQKMDAAGGTTNPPLSYTLMMPNFGANVSPLYYSINGQCGQVLWNSLTSAQGGGLDTATLSSSYNMNQAEINSISLSRAIALQQLYESLSPAAQTMVDNDPMINLDLISDEASDASVVAQSQFGVVKNGPSTTCSAWSDNCNQWSGAEDTKSPAVLFNGNEFYNAMTAYNTIMLPTLNLITQMNNQTQAEQVRAFIDQTETEGWMFAGSYFFNLVNLSGSPTSGAASIDSLGGMNKSSFYGLNLTCDTIPNINTLCWLMYGTSSSSPDLSLIGDVKFLIDADQTNASHKKSICSYVAEGKVQDTSLSFSSYDASTGYIDPNAALASLSCSSTVFGFIGNTYFLAIPGQPGIEAPAFPGLDFPSYDFSKFNLHMPSSIPCGGVPFLGCLGRVLLSGFWTVLTNVVNSILYTLQMIATMIFNLMVIVPLKMTIMPVLTNAYNALTAASLNPIVNLANMGGYVIDATIAGYLELLALSMLGAIPYVGTFITVLMSFMLPLYTSWLAFFLSIGFLTAYYVPLLPYMIFTFGAIAWLTTVVEAMVGAPLMALGMIMPEGEGIFGKSEQGMMLLVAVFLRPALMIVGFISGIALTFVSVWIMNQGFANASVFLSKTSYSGIDWTNYLFTQVFARIFFIAIYLSIYITVVQKSFNLIFLLPDRILRWIGGQAEHSDTAQWLEESKQKAERFGQSTEKGWVKGMHDTPAQIKKNIGSKSDNDSSGAGG